MKNEGGWWHEFFKADPSNVNQFTVISAFITVLVSLMAIPAMILGLAAVYHHCWTLKKGLDGGAAQVILALAGGGGVGMGLGYGMSRLGIGPSPTAPPCDPNPPKAKPAPTAP